MAGAGDTDGFKAGDSALAAVLAFHGPAMNGGVLHAVECLSTTELAAACAGFRYFGLHRVAAFLGEASRAVADGEDLEELEGNFNEQYWREASDAVLDRVFNVDYSARPENYAPIQ